MLQNKSCKNCCTCVFWGSTTRKINNIYWAECSDNEKAPCTFRGGLWKQLMKPLQGCNNYSLWPPINQ